MTYTPFTPGGTIGGTVKPGWEKVKDAFANNFSQGREKGAQLVIKLEGETVVDLWGSSACCTTTKGPYDGTPPPPPPLPPPRGAPRPCALAFPRACTTR